MTLSQVESLCVLPFTGQTRRRRETLFYSFEDLWQRILIERLHCVVYANGSFFTQHPNPDDVDIIVSIDLDVSESLTDTQRILIDDLNKPFFIENVQSYSGVSYPMDHSHFGTALDLHGAGDEFGIEHAGYWLKGYGIMRPSETDVGIFICR